MPAARMYRVLKSIVNEKSREKEHAQEAEWMCAWIAHVHVYLQYFVICGQVKISARIRSKPSADILKPQLDAFASDIAAASSSMLGSDGKPLKMPKPKKVLTPEQVQDKALVTAFKRPGVGCVSDDCICKFQLR